jgi:N-acetylglucosaminyldiphosphoundecaprenol N-acetyl-beta-D-mannosaminyltransferase
LVVNKSLERMRARVGRGGDMAISTEQDKPPFVNYMNTKINTVNYCQVHELIQNTIANRGHEYICLTDVGNVISAANDQPLQTAINASLLSLADGAPLAYYARLAGYRNVERISGVRLMESLFSEKDEFSHFLLGDTDRTINEAICKAKEINGRITINGYSPPFRDFSGEDNRAIIEKINTVHPDIVWVCFGGGKQEKWMWENIGRLETGIMIGVGSALRWFTGELKVPPAIVQKLCLQWCYRLASECAKGPRRCESFFMERQFRKFPRFLKNFPAELARARMTSKRNGGNIPQ